MSTINQIIEGTINNLLNLEDELYKERIVICRSCRLIKIDKIFGEICNPSMYLNPDNNDVSSVPKLGYYHGCGCVLRSKCRVQTTHCPLNRW